MPEQLANDLQGQMQCVTFTLEDEVYGINVMQVQEVLREIGSRSGARCAALRDRYYQFAR